MYGRTGANGDSYTCDNNSYCDPDPDGTATTPPLSGFLE
jgi:hypothetical protein